ncbi:carboxypeptidase regulatory-like domain-containing protein [Catellatospora sp. NPDC049609]|uniref:carboxypeptidase regulatory-like domain-containing protein n=1 Tax=Catellatospora sp. NPDC049609 TaxID=3155505 RepID=UPI0034232899
MRRHTLRRLGLTLLTIAVATMGLAAPAHAETETGTISGRLTDNGAPVANAWVDASGTGWGYAYTDGNGDYRITDLTPGDDYRVTFRADGHVVQYAHQELAWDAAARFTVTAGADTVVNDELLPTGTITGRVTRPDGTPARWAYVSAVNGLGDALVDATTDIGGHYAMQVPAGTYRIRLAGNVGVQFAPGVRTFDEAGLYTVGTGQTLAVDYTTLAVGTITGRITRSDGSPVPHRSIYAEPAGDGPTAGGTSTDTDGRYSMEVFPGQYVVMYETGSESTAYVPNSPDRAGATVFTVVADTVTTVDETLAPMGSAEGRFTDLQGAGMANVRVTLRENTTGFSRDGTTDEQGRWRVDDLVPGRYKVRFTGMDRPLDQWAYGKTSATAADAVTVTAGQTVTVDDTKLAGGSIRITAKNSVTGAPVLNFWAGSGAYSDSTDNGTLVLAEVPAGTFHLSASAEGYPYYDQAFPVNVVAGQETAVELVLEPYAKIRTKVVDAATGAPIAGVCLFTATTDRFRLHEGCAGASGADGVATLETVAPGRYQIFALPPSGSPYGAQWVGQDGGTGDQRAAKSWTVTTGQVRDIQKIRMDRAGVVTGVVTGADGSPVTRGTVAVATPTIGDNGRGAVGVDAQGRYTIGFLGPYQWPLSFQVPGHAWQWSGGQAKRHDAVPVAVRSGQTTTFDQRLKLGSEVWVTAAGAPADGFAAAYTVSTGDLAGYVHVPVGGAEAVYRVLGSQQVKLQYAGGDGANDGWYGGSGFASATPVRVYANGTPTVVAYQYS